MTNFDFFLCSFINFAKNKCILKSSFDYAKEFDESLT